MQARDIGAVSYTHLDMYKSQVEGFEHSGVNLYAYSMRWEKVKFSGMIKETADKTDSDHTEWEIYENDKS